MRFAKLAAGVAGIVFGSTLSLAADKPVDKKDKTVKPAATANKTATQKATGGTQ